MRKPISIGVIGAGFGQHVHVPAFRADQRCVVNAICAQRPDRAQEAARSLVIPKVYGDWQQLLADAEIDAVSLAVPPATQATIALEAARAGKHIFCEKPLSVNAEQARQILAAAKNANVAHAMDFIFPEIPAWQKTLELINGSALGRVRHAALAWRIETYTFRAGLESWKRDTETGGGTLGNFASHTLYYFEWLFGPICRLAANLRPSGSKAGARVEAWLEFAAGFDATISIAADAFLGLGHRLEVYGDDGSLVLENKTSDHARGFTLAMGTRQTGKLVAVEVAPDDSPGDGRIVPVSRIAQRFLDAIISGNEVTPNLRHGLRVQVLMDTIRVADRERVWQSVPTE